MKAQYILWITFDQCFDDARKKHKTTVLEILVSYYSNFAYHSDDRLDMLYLLMHGTIEH